MCVYPLYTRSAFHLTAWSISTSSAWWKWTFFPAQQTKVYGRTKLLLLLVLLNLKSSCSLANFASASVRRLFRVKRARRRRRQKASRLSLRRVTSPSHNYHILSGPSENVFSAALLKNIHERLACFIYASRDGRERERARQETAFLSFP